MLADVLARGHQVALPFGEDTLFDLIVVRGGRPERVQIKHARSDGRRLVVKAQTHSLTNGRVRTIHRYTAADIEWLAVWDATTDRSAYIPSTELGEGCSEITLRLAPARNGQRERIRFFADFLEF